MAAAGRILIIPRGAYDPTMHYEFLDLVSANNNLWLCRGDLIGIEPNENNSDHWFKFTDIGVANNLTTESEGYLLDARQGAILFNLISNVEVTAKTNKESVKQLKNDLQTTTNIAKGRNKARIFETTEEMEDWLADETNKGLCSVGDNLYIIDVGVPDWWVAEVLETADEETGWFYKISQLEVQKVDLTDLNEKMFGLEEDLGNLKLFYDAENKKYYAQYGEDESTKKLLGEIEKDKLIEALAYSGLGLTEESTPEEIYTTLAIAFPENVYVFKDGVLLTNVSLLEIDIIDSALYKRISASNDESVNATCKISNIDFTKYNKLIFTVTARGHSDYPGSSAIGSEIKYGIDGASNSFVYSDDETFTKTVTMDISSLEGMHELDFYLYCKCDSSNTNWGASVYISISEIELVV